MSVVQVGFALHVRNTLIWCASEGARFGARQGSSPGAGAARTREAISSSVASSYASNVSAHRANVGGVDVVEVVVEAPLPLVALAGPAGAVTVSARAFAEDQE